MHLLLNQGCLRFLWVSCLAGLLCCGFRRIRSPFFLPSLAVSGFIYGSVLWICYAVWICLFVEEKCHISVLRFFRSGLKACLSHTPSFESSGYRVFTATLIAWCCWSIWNIYSLSEDASLGWFSCCLRALAFHVILFSGWSPSGLACLIGMLFLCLGIVFYLHYLIFFSLYMG